MVLKSVVFRMKISDIEDENAMNQRMEANISNMSKK